MSGRFRLSAALDVDDLLMECVPYAIRLANEKYKFDPPLSIHEVNGWGKLGTRADVIFEFFDDPSFFKNQPVIEGAREFVRKLSTMTDVFIATSITPKFMGIRAARIMKEFPEIPPDHIYMGAGKDKLNVDILFDDGMHNVFKSNASFPILMRRPWNQSATGMLAVNNYDEFLKLVELIKARYSKTENTRENAKILALVGPSGSGKSEIAQEILALDQRFEKLVSYTTKKHAKDDRAYNYLTKREFEKMLDRGEFFESTMYATHGFGSKREDVTKILDSGKLVLTVMDICGAMSLKTNFPDVVTVYIKRDTKELLYSILESGGTTDDKVNRIISINDERRNEEICDRTVNFKDPKSSALEILSFIK